MKSITQLEKDYAYVQAENDMLAKEIWTLLRDMKAIARLAALEKAIAAHQRRMNNWSPPKVRSKRKLK